MPQKKSLHTRAYEILFVFVHLFIYFLIALITSDVLDSVLTQQCITWTDQGCDPEQRIQAQIFAQAGSEAGQIQEKLDVPLSLVFACPLLVIHYAEKFLTIEEIAEKHNDGKVLRTG